MSNDPSDLSWARCLCAHEYGTHGAQEAGHNAQHAGWSLVIQEVHKKGNLLVYFNVYLILKVIPLT